MGLGGADVVVVPPVDGGGLSHAGATTGDAACGGVRTAGNAVVARDGVAGDAAGTSAGGGSEAVAGLDAVVAAAAGRAALG